MHDSNSRRRKLRDALIPFTLISLFTLLISLALSAPALADPPGRIGRVAWLSAPGGLTLDNGTRGESFQPAINQPLTSGDVLRTDANTRAEIQIGSTTLRLDEGTSLELTRIDDERVNLFLRGGRSIVKLTSPETAREFELGTPDGRFTARETGIFRVEANGNGSSATTYDGALRFTAADTDFDIRAGERAEIWFAGQTRYRMSPPVSDDFMHWSAARDRRPMTNVSSRYVSPEMTGADDLDAWGDWTESPEYGPLWTPRSVAADWAPYRSGHWAWVAPWGWSWVGHEPWGFAPFHYGRWIQHRGRWAWVPGAYLARPVYAPAMVAWTPAPGVTLTFSSGRPPTAGWFPLAPREVYVPFYRSSPDYVRRVNRTHVARIDDAELIVRRPHDAGRDMRYVHRDLPRRSLERDTPIERLPPASTFQRDDDDRRRDDKRHETRERERERTAESRPQARPHRPARPQHPDMAFFEPSRQAKPTARVLPHEARPVERQVSNQIKHRADKPRRAQAEDDPRKRRLRPEGNERH